jgi:hypothetical protein
MSAFGTGAQGPLNEALADDQATSAIAKFTGHPLQASVVLEAVILGDGSSGPL